MRIFSLSFLSNFPVALLGKLVGGAKSFGRNYGSAMMNHLRQKNLFNGSNLQDLLGRHAM